MLSQQAAGDHRARRLTSGDDMMHVDRYVVCICPTRQSAAGAAALARFADERTAVSPYLHRCHNIIHAVQPSPTHEVYSTQQPRSRYL